MTAPMPWPASHIGLSSVLTDDLSQAVVVSGKIGKEVTNRIGLYDIKGDTWTELVPKVPFGQPDFLAWFDAPKNEFLNVLKFRWHPTNSTLNDDYKSITKTSKKVLNWPNAFTHFRAKVLYEDVSPSSSIREKQESPFVFRDSRPIRKDFGVELHGVDLSKILSSSSEKHLESFAVALRSMLDRFGLVYFPSPIALNEGERQISQRELVALHALLEHDKSKASNSYHKGMCRLWRQGLPQINLLANKAARAYAEALKDDGEACLSNTVYGMETYAWHADEASRPHDLAVRYTAFHGAVVENASEGETHFASGAFAFDRLDEATKRKAMAIDVKYLANPKSKDAFLPPLDVAGKRDAYLEKDGVAKFSHAAAFFDDLVDSCRMHRTCDTHTSPLVVPHPRTKRPALHLDVKQQLGFQNANFSDAQNFLRQILRPATANHNIYKHRWKIGDIIIADNYHVLHTAAPTQFFNDKARLIERICLPGGYAPEKLHF